MNSQQWWTSVKNDNVKLMNWLKNQYHGEVTASQRIRSLLKSQTSNKNILMVLESIAQQEEQHAEWIKQLLLNRGLEAHILIKKERYWEETLPSIKDFVSGCAVAAKAEIMRLERIRAIASDSEAPEDIRKTFEKILVDEEFHATAFRAFTSDVAFDNAAAADERGRNALGLEP